LQGRKQKGHDNRQMMNLEKKTSSEDMNERDMDDDVEMMTMISGIKTGLTKPG